MSKGYKKYISIISGYCCYGFSGYYCRAVRNENTTKEQLFILKRFSLNFWKILAFVMPDFVGYMYIRSKISPFRSVELN